MILSLTKVKYLLATKLKRDDEVSYSITNIYKMDTTKMGKQQLVTTLESVSRVWATVSILDVCATIVNQQLSI